MIVEEELRINIGADFTTGSGAVDETKNSSARCDWEQKEESPKLKTVQLLP